MYETTQQIKYVPHRESEEIVVCTGTLPNRSGYVLYFKEGHLEMHEFSDFTSSSGVPLRLQDVPKETIMEISRSSKLKKLEDMIDKDDEILGMIVEKRSSG